MPTVFHYPFHLLHSSCAERVSNNVTPCSWVRLFNAKERGQLFAMAILRAFQTGQVAPGGGQRFMSESPLDLRNRRADLLHGVREGVPGGMDFAGPQIFLADDGDREV